MTGEFIEFFEELLYGSGAIIGVLVIAVLLTLLVMRVKYGSIITIPISAILIVLYWENIEAYSLVMWNSVIMFFTIVLALILEGTRNK